MKSKTSLGKGGLFAQALPGQRGVGMELKLSHLYIGITRLTHQNAMSIMNPPRKPEKQGS